MDETLKAEASQWKNKPYEPKPTWIFKRSDGEIIYAEEAQAWELINSRGEWRRHDFQLVGMSDFKLFKKLIDEGEKEIEVMKLNLVQLRDEVRRYEMSYERFKFDELLEETDEKVIRVNTILKEKNKAIQSLVNEIEVKRSNLHKEALEKEMELARGNKATPQNQDVHYPFGRKNDIGNVTRN